jgi:hypothetical protein
MKSQDDLFIFQSNDIVLSVHLLGKQRTLVFYLILVHVHRAHLDQLTSWSRGHSCDVQ